MARFESARWILCLACVLNVMIAIVRGEGYTGEACRVPEPGNELVECDWQTGDPRPSRKPWRWGSNEIADIPPWPPIEAWGGKVEFTDPEEGSIAEAIAKCKEYGGAVGTFQMVSAYWFHLSNFTSGFPNVHSWKPFNIWDGHTGPSGLGTPCRLGILAGRTFGMSHQDPTCKQPGTRFVCVRCIEGRLWDPTIVFSSASSTVRSQFGEMKGQCVEECSEGRVGNGGGCNPE